MPQACGFAASGVIGNELFIAGGARDSNTALSTLQIYDFTARTWRVGAPLPRAECGARGIVVGDGRLYLVPLRDSRSTMVYAVQSNTWTEQPGLPADLGQYGAMHAFAHNGRIVVVYANGTAFHRGTESADWSRFDDSFVPIDYWPMRGVAESVILG